MNEKDARQLEREILSPDAKQFSLAREGENERIVVDTENLARGSGGREEGWKEKMGEGRGVDLWKFGGPAESTHRGLLRAKGDGGWEKHGRDEGRSGGDL